MAFSVVFQQAIALTQTFILTTANCPQQGDLAGIF